MRVKLTKTWASAHGCGKEGDVVDVPSKVAKQLIAADAAERDGVVENTKPATTDSTPPQTDLSNDRNADPADHSAEEESTSESTDADAQGDDANGAATPSAEGPSQAEGTPPRRPLTLKRGNK